MRKKFSEREIKDYIDGKDIEDIDLLEANPYFMSEVIKIAKDYNTYEVYCDDKIKIHPIIMKTMLEVFGNSYLEKDSKNFYKGLSRLSKKTETIDNYYSNNNSINTQFLEMLVLLFNIDHMESDIVNDYFDKELEPFTDEYGAITEECDGLFGNLCNKYNSDIIQKFFAVKLAEKIINDVLYDGIDNLSYRGIENIVHNKVFDKHLLDEEMVICSIISCIAETDRTLADYLSEHKELLNQYGRYAKSYYEHWDNYETDKLFNTIDAFASTVEKYMIDYQISASSEMIVRAIGRKFNMENAIDDYYKRLAEKLIINNDELDDALYKENQRKQLLEKYRDINNYRRVENMLDNNPIYRPLLSLAKRTFSTDDNKVLSLASPITGKLSSN